MRKARKALHATQIRLEQNRLPNGQVPHRPILPDPPKGSPQMSNFDPTTSTESTGGIGLYGKAFAAAVVAAMGVYATGLQDGPGLTAAEWIAVVLAFLASFGVVWSIPQTPKVFATYGKAIFSGVAALLTSLGTGLLDGSLSQTEVVTAIIAFALASGLTGAVSNAAASDPVVNGRLVGVSHRAKARLVGSSDDGI